MKRIEVNEKIGTTAISVRLPDPLLERLDKLATAMGSHRTDVIRRSLATYFRLDKAMLVPLSRESMHILEELSEERDCGIEALAGQFLEEAIREQCHGSVQTILKIRTFQAVSVNFESSDNDEDFGFTYNVPTETKEYAN